MTLWRRIEFLLHISRAHGIARRYFFTNGYDGALTQLGVNMGFYGVEPVPASVALGACMGAAVALSISGLTSAYISESEERKKELADLESALVADLGETGYGQATRWVPLFVAGVNGLSPLLVSLFIMIPYGMELYGMPIAASPERAAIAFAFIAIFLLGVLLGRVGGTFWLWTGLRALLIAAVTGGIILVLP
ncbi:MAG: hypothetical protein JSU88_06040 [Nitrospinaceae bacterium]|jgi:predicted membrane protein (TIGR00267 family)|nr:MAG: hypothetical protein JSU88_06040 [Nitrospinaceae bacterium]